jgi:hypothetical protein
MFETERAQAAVGGVPTEERLRGREVWRSMVFLVRNSSPLNMGIRLKHFRLGYHTCVLKRKTTSSLLEGVLTRTSLMRANRTDKLEV